MTKYSRNDSQTENLVEDDLQPEHQQADVLTVDIIDSRNFHLGIETIVNRDVTFQHNVFPKSCANQKEFLRVNNLCVKGNLKEALNDDTIASEAKMNCWDSPNWIRVALPFVIGLALLSGTLGIIFLLFKMPEDLTLYYPYTNVMPSSDSEYPKDVGLCFVHREDWQAEPPIELIRRQSLPAERVVISHTATAPCYRSDKCKEVLKITQLFHVNSQEFSDIAYNFMVGGDGCVYIGRGWDYIGAHTLRYNFKSVGITLIGTYTFLQPTRIQMDAVQELIALGVKLGRLSPSYVLNGMCQLRDTESPGKFVYDIIVKWKSFQNTTETPPCKLNNIKSTVSTLATSSVGVEELPNSTSS